MCKCSILKYGVQIILKAENSILLCENGKVAKLQRWNIILVHNYENKSYIYYFSSGTISKIQNIWKYKVLWCYQQVHHNFRQCVYTVHLRIGWELLWPYCLCRILIVHAWQCLFMSTILLIECSNLLLSLSTWYTSLHCML